MKVKHGGSVGGKRDYSINSAGKIIIHIKKKEIGSLTHTMIKINHREIKDLKIKSKKFKLLVANMDKYVSGFWLVKEFLRHRKY